MDDTGLPIEGAIPELRAALTAGPSAVLVAPPGSGKTTVVPLRLLGEPWLGGEKIVVLEPRRIATRAAASRMAHLLGEAVGETVGYVTRGDRRVGPQTRVEVITEGVLTRRLQRDPELTGTGLVIFDELHERNLQTDLGLALALDARQTLRPDLRLLAMSATIDAARIAALLGGGEPAPVVVGEAAEHPVEIRWKPLRDRRQLVTHVAATIREAVAAEPGDVLVFLPGMGEMRRVRDQLGDIGAEVMLLHGSLPADEQDAALAPPRPGVRKVVLSTDIAESSLTVQGVRIVIDSGLARSPRLDLRHGMTRLHTISISRASADQRSGRAGRIEPGVAYRLWSKLEHGGRHPHIDPEITKVDLAGLALELALWGVADPAALPFLDQPPAKTFAAGRQLLKLLGALDESGSLTNTGRAMATLPLHPRLARMVIDAGADQQLATIVAALVDDRDVLRGHPDDVPVDLALRVRLIADPTASHPAAMGRSLQRVRHTAADLARRAGVTGGEVDPDHTGRVLALAFPDRLAVRRGSPGRFQLRTGTTAWLAAADPLGVESFLVPADLDGKRKNARIRLAAAIDAHDVAERFAHEISDKVSLTWDGDRLVERRERRLGGVSLDTQDRRPQPGPDVTEALLRRIGDNELRDLPWTSAASALRSRVEFLQGRLGDPWPDWSTARLVATVEEWLGPYLAAATGLDDMARLDLLQILRNHLGYPAATEVDQLVPTHVEIPSGRRVAVDYSGEVPTIAAKVQEFFGATQGPRIAGEPVLLMLLSPADRPLQITSDLGGFWTGSWAEVRKDMAGRYPKHEWPEDPASAEPVRK